MFAMAGDLKLRELRNYQTTRLSKVFEMRCNCIYSFIDSSRSQHGVISESSRSHLGTTLKPSCCHLGATLEPSWSHLRLARRKHSSRSQHGVISESSRSHLGTTLKPSCCHLGATLEPSWSHLRLARPWGSGAGMCPKGSLQPPILWLQVRCGEMTPAGLRAPEPLRHGGTYSFALNNRGTPATLQVWTNSHAASMPPFEVLWSSTCLPSPKSSKSPNSSIK